MVIFVNHKSQYQRCEGLTYDIDNEFESVFIRVNDKGNNLCIAGVYMVPNTSEILPINGYEELLSKLSRVHCYGCS